VVGFRLAVVGIADPSPLAVILLMSSGSWCLTPVDQLVLPVLAYSFAVQVQLPIPWAQYSAAVEAVKGEPQNQARNLALQCTSVHPPRMVTVVHR
jgi:hypothetical protein